MAEKLTTWFPGGIKPKRKGVYQQLFGTRGKVGYQYWDGRQWYSWCERPEHAQNKIPAANCFQNDKWRGLSSNPKDTK